MNNLKTFSIYTLGCKVNIYDSNVIRTTLLSYGLIEVDFNNKPDVYIINTCSVTNKADSKSQYIINKAKRLNPNAIIVACGCYSQVNDKIPNADIILGNKYKNKIYEIILEYKQNNTVTKKIDNLLLEKEFESYEVNEFDKTRAFLKIQEGCNFMCSYCIIPFTRGKQRSKDLELIIQDIYRLVNNGYKEIVLTGVNTAGYLDKNNNNFLDLLKNINDIHLDFRVRISSVEPFQINDEIINLVSNNKKFAQHWHICLQSANNDILKKMNRKYTIEEFMDLINKIYKLNPYASISTDYIVGFPTETNEQFLYSLEYCKKIGFSSMHIFPYSIRKYTQAARLEQVDEKTKSDRMKIALDLNKKLVSDFIKKFINRTTVVLVEKKSDSKYIAKSSEYFDVILKSNIDLVNKFVEVKITSCVFDTAIAEIIKVY